MVTAKALSCVVDAKDYHHFPFQYRAKHGALIPKGQAFTPKHGGEALCIYPEAYDTCLKQQSTGHHLTFKNGTSYQCCEETDALKHTAGTVWMYPLIAYGIFAVLMSRYHRYIAAKAKREGTPKAPNPRGEEWAKLSMCKKAAVMACCILFIGAIVTEPIIMERQKQQALTPVDRAAQLAMSNFLTPVAEVFAFLEDVMVVEVGYAMAAGRYADLNVLLNVSVVGGLACGAVAFGLLAIVALVKPAAAVILNPSGGANRALIDAGCGLVPATADLLKHAVPYWFFQTAAWIPNFATKGLVGFYVGTGQLGAYALGPMVGAVIPIAIWFALKGRTAMSPLVLLGLAYGVDAWLVGAWNLCYVRCSAALREKYRLRWLLGEWWRDWRAGRRGFREGLLKSKIVRDGVHLMMVDLAVQLSLSVTIYVASAHQFEAAFKLGAVQAAYWSFGPSYVMGVFFVVKLLGAAMISKGKFEQYLAALQKCVLLVLAMGAAAIVAAVTLRDAVAFDYGKAACVFASSESCASAYHNVFGGRDAMDRVFEAFGPVVLLNMLFMTSRMSLACCHDFAFMAKAAVWTFVIVFTPAILVARFAFDGSTTALYVAMYLPHFVMSVVFSKRMWAHARAMREGRPGPWTDHSRRMSVANPSSLDVLIGLSDAERAALAALAAENGGAGGDDVEAEKKGNEREAALGGAAMTDPLLK